MTDKLDSLIVPDSEVTLRKDLMRINQRIDAIVTAQKQKFRVAEHEKRILKLEHRTKWWRKDFLSWLNTWGNSIELLGHCEEYREGYKQAIRDVFQKTKELTIIERSEYRVSGVTIK